jgi:hypothetical protein
MWLISKGKRFVALKALRKTGMIPIVRAKLARNPVYHVFPTTQAAFDEYRFVIFFTREVQLPFNV